MEKKNTPHKSHFINTECVQTRPFKIQQSSVALFRSNIPLGMKMVVWARVRVAVVGYEKCRLMPPVEHEHHQYVPDLMAGAQIVQLT